MYIYLASSSYFSRYSDRNYITMPTNMWAPCTPTLPAGSSWIEKYSDHTEYRAKMLTEPHVLIAKGKNIWKTYSSQKMSELKRGNEAMRDEREHFRYPRK